jgi:hypothetical protein
MNFAGLGMDFSQFDAVNFGNMYYTHTAGRIIVAYSRKILNRGPINPHKKILLKRYTHICLRLAPSIRRVYKIKVLCAQSIDYALPPVLVKLCIAYIYE